MTDQLKCVRATELSGQTTQTPGLLRKTAIDGQSVGARTLWMGRVTAEPGMASGIHHHGDSESAIFLISGHLTFRFGEGLTQSVDAGPGDYVYVPPNCVHLEVNRSATQAADLIVVRDNQENIVVPVEVPGA